MPSATPLGVTLTNWGPLTATFTPPAACVSSAEFVNLAPTKAPEFPEWSNNCDWDLEKCLPPKEDARGSQDDESNYVLGYYSPASICPSGWETVGVASRGEEADSTPTVKGVFTHTETEQEESTATPFQAHNALPLALKPGETVIACCPSSMTPAPYGGCTSELPSYPSSLTTACARILPAGNMETITSTISADGATVTETLLSAFGNAALATSTTSFASSETDGYVAASWLPMVVLVDGSSEETETPNAGSVARVMGGRRGVAGSSWSEVGGMLGALGAAFGIGAAVVGW
ncbi:uncharacterized protein BJX67DRAFT_166961 [Aspergillus lucknowensis]|uniref:Uncharacterized protein n=1 Tax=Aspergillus lucknowensis TaxID=176173 RepID=A0ABR4M4W8_9EURO